MLTLAFALALQSATTPPISESELAGVRAAVEDYVRALYDVEPARIERSVEPTLVKEGVVSRDGKTQRWPMTYEQLVNLAGDWNVDQKNVDPAKGLTEIQVLGILPRVAAAKLRAHWGVDYMQLIRHDDGWKISHIVWQRHPDDSFEATADEREAAAAAGFDYIDAIYQGKPELIERSVARDLAKFGYARRAPGEEFQRRPFDFDALTKLAKGPRDWVPENPTRDVRVLDLSDRTGVIEIHGTWGIDYAHITKVENRWKIQQIVWQSHPTDEEITTVLPISASRNQDCPFSGKPVVADSLTLFQGSVVGFCNPGCRDKFARNPLAHMDAVELFTLRQRRPASAGKASGSGNDE